MEGGIAKLYLRLKNKNKEGSFQIRYTYFVYALIPKTISQLNLNLSDKIPYRKYF
jgi:hypothetical protein